MVPVASQTPAPAEGRNRLARCLIIGCGCRGGQLARALVAHGHAVRGTTRSPVRARKIEAAGAQPFIADPDRIATLMPAIDQVAVVCLLLGSAHGERARLEALHGPRLEMFLARLIDTPVRGLVYETRGSVPEEMLADGSDLVRHACERSRVSFALLEATPEDREAWLAAALAGVERLLS